MKQNFNTTIKNKRVIFVCPSKVLKGKGLGEWIDKFDVVIRTNNSFLVDKKLQKDYGSRCDILYVNNQFTKECSPFPIKTWRNEGLTWICFKCGVNRKEIYEPYMNLRSIAHVYNQIKEEVNSPLMGTLMIRDILNYNPKQFTIAGMNFYNGKILDWENQYIDGYLPPKILIPAQQKRAKGFFTKSKIHDTESNKKYVISLYKQGLLDFDNHTKLALGLRKLSKFERPPKKEEIIKMDEKINTDLPLNNLIKRSISIRNAKNAKSGLQDMCNYLKKKLDISKELTILEIGAFAGDSTEIFAKNFDKVISVDPWKSGYDPADKASDPNIFNMASVEKQFDVVMNTYNNITKMKMKSLEAASKFKDESLDIIYIDGLHTYLGVKADIELWLSKIKGQSIICGHDFQGKFPGTIKAVQELLGNKGQIIKFLDTSWVWVKHKN